MSEREAVKVECSTSCNVTISEDEIVVEAYVKMVRDINKQMKETVTTKSDDADVGIDVKRSYVDDYDYYEPWGK